jgi:hypothetical protein
MIRRNEASSFWGRAHHKYTVSGKRKTPHHGNYTVLFDYANFDHREEFHI